MFNSVIEYSIGLYYPIFFYTSMILLKNTFICQVIKKTLLSIYPKIFYQITMFEYYVKAIG